MPTEPDIPSTSNLLLKRDPELVKELKAFRGQLGVLFPGKLDAILDNSSYRHHDNSLPLEELKAIAQVIRVLTKDIWTEEDLDLFDASWRDVNRSELFGAEFESSRHQIQILVDTARTQLLTQQSATEQSRMKQRTLW